MSSAWSFYNSASSLGLILKGILLWACALGVQSVRDQRANLPSLLSSFRYRGTDQRTLLKNFLDCFLNLGRVCHLNKTKILRGLETYQGLSVHMSLYNMKRGRGDSSVRLNNGLKFPHDLQWRRRAFVRLVCTQNTR